MGLVYGLADQRGLNPGREPAVCPLGDSITFGVNAQTLAGWREPLYNLGQAGGVGQKFFFVGTQNFAGNGGGLAADPFNEGRPGYVIRTQGSFGSLNALTPGILPLSYPQVAILAGGTNDLASNVLNDDVATVAASVSTWLDTVWATRKWSWFQIVLCTILKRLDADDSKVQAANALFANIVASKSYSGHVTLVDMYASIADPTIGTGGYNDAVHPNDVGYTDMATAMWDGDSQTYSPDADRLDA